MIAVYGTRYYLWKPLDLAVCMECSAVIANDPQAIRKHYAWHARIDGPGPISGGDSG